MPDAVEYPSLAKILAPQIAKKADEIGAALGQMNTGYLTAPADSYSTVMAPAWIADEAARKLLPNAAEQLAARVDAAGARGPGYMARHPISMADLARNVAQQAAPHALPARTPAFDINPENLNALGHSRLNKLQGSGVVAPQHGPIATTPEPGPNDGNPHDAGPGIAQYNLGTADDLSPDERRSILKNAPHSNGYLHFTQSQLADMAPQPTDVKGKSVHEMAKEIADDLSAQRRRTAEVLFAPGGGI